MDIDDRVKQLIKYQLIVAFYEGCAGALCAPSIIKLQGTLFSVTEMSWILLLPALLKTVQVYMTKLNDKRSLYAPMIVEFIYPMLVIVLLISVKMFLILDIVILAVFSILYNNRFSRISELTKSYYNINKFHNTWMSMISIGTVTGYICSIVITRYFNPIQILVVMHIISVWIVIPMWVINKNVLVIKNYKVNAI